MTPFQCLNQPKKIQAVDPQSVCPGYSLVDAENTSTGFSGTLVLAGPACNVYGNEIPSLRLIVEYQADDRLHVEILPTYIGPKNTTWFVLPEQYIRKPSSNGSISSDLFFYYSNTPTFSFNVTRISTGDVLFTTSGRKLVFEDQFIQIGSDLPSNYNL